MKLQKLFLVLYVICIFLSFAKSCLQRHGFSKVEDVREKNTREPLPKNNQTPNPLNSNVKYLKSPRSASESTTGQIDKLVDDALRKFIAYIQKANGGKMPLPNMSTTYESDSGFFAVTVVFTAKNGSFSNLATVRRKSKPIIRRSGQKIELLCALGPEIAQVNYDSVNVVYGFMNMDGNLVANLSPLTLGALVSADYSQKPCVTRLEQLKVVQMGPITTVVSGMGLFGGSVQGAVDDYIQSSYNKIRRMITIQTGRVIISRLPLFDCESFRHFLKDL